jgi:outer membrane protein OmpA-like peptidoglycan-associated protein
MDLSRKRSGQSKKKSINHYIMKTSFHVKILSVVIILCSLCSAVHAADYYVVIGAFAQESNARRFTGTVKNFFRDVSYSFNAEKHLFYVHVMHTTRKDEARNWSSYLRNEKGFKDAWVLTKTGVPSYKTAADAPDVHEPRYEVSLQLAPTTSDVIASPSAANGEASFSNTTTYKENKSETAWTMANGFGFVNNIKDIERFKSEQSITSSNLFTFIVEDSRGHVVPSEVMLVNFEKVKKIASFQTGENVAIKGTKPNQMVTFVCDMLGYSQETRMFNMDHLSRGKDITKNENGVWEVRIKLKKMAMNDIALMNNTSFYKDAAVLEPSSQKEMDELVAMMKSNPGYRILVHSHCNPGERGSIKVANETTYFDIKASTERPGSDKLLTKKRGELVRNYLLNHGIDKKRVGMVAWGSAETIVKSASEDAYINDRIEIELVNEL